MSIGHKPAAAAPIQLLSWEFPYVAGIATKKTTNLNIIHIINKGED